MKKVLVIDNYDSFTYNLVHLLKEIGSVQVDVVRNDKTTLEAVAQYKKILLSPGPGIPNEAGLMPQIVKTYAATHSIFGVCLGHQCIGEIFGATLINMKAPVHGKAHEITVTTASEPLFKGLGSKFVAGRYHSWLVDKKNFPSCLEITATDAGGDIMALRHREFDVRGVQFHPESVLTQKGKIMLENWMAL